MKLSEYLDARGESQPAFAERAKQVGKVSQRTISRAANGHGVHSYCAWVIVETSRLEPTEDGGTVTLADLIGEANGARPAA